MRPHVYIWFSVGGHCSEWYNTERPLWKFPYHRGARFSLLLNGRMTLCEPTPWHRGNIWRKAKLPLMLTFLSFMKQEVQLILLFVVNLIESVYEECLYILHKNNDSDNGNTCKYTFLLWLFTIVSIYGKYFSDIKETISSLVRSLWHWQTNFSHKLTAYFYLFYISFQDWIGGFNYYWHSSTFLILKWPSRQ